MKSVDNTIRLMHSINSEDNYNKLYLFTNENLKAILKKIDLEDKKIFTVCSSSDQYLNFLLQNPKSIELFDKNILTEHLLYLKIAAILNLDYDTFIEFFIPQKKFKNKQLFSNDIYNQINQDLPPKIKLHWDALFINNCIDIFKSDLFLNNKYNAKENINNNNYLQNEDNYLKLKNKLKNIDNIKFYNINIFEDKINTKNKYDFIYLSNIIDYLPIVDKIKYLNKVKEIISSLSNNLNQNGIIGLNYLFQYLDEYWEKTNNYLKKEVKDIIIYNKKPQDGYKVIEFESGMNYKSRKLEDRDALLLYIKK